MRSKRFLGTLPKENGGSRVRFLREGLVFDLGCPGTAHKVQDERDYGKDQQQVNQATGYVENAETQDPSD